MQQQPGRFKCALARVSHFFPHSFIALAPVAIALLVACLMFVEDAAVPLSQQGLSATQWIVTLTIAVIISAVGIWFTVTVHYHCPICQRFREHPHHSRWMFALSRLWYTPAGPAWTGIVLALVAAVIGLFVHPAFIILFWLLMSLNMLGIIAYRRSGGGRIQRRPASPETEASA